MRQSQQAEVFVGREAELDVFRALLSGVVGGRGRSVLVEGEPGIGKSALVTMGLAGARDRGCRVLWAVGDELGCRFPLRALLDCLTADEQAAVVAKDVASGPVTAGDAVLAGVERLLVLVDQLCARSPVVFVLDDLHWADEASLLVWGRLSRAVDQLPLLLVGTCRPVPRRTQVAGLRRTLVEHAASVMTLEPLPAQRIADLVAGLVGAAGPRLLAMAQQAGGNPLYVRELVDALLREHQVEEKSDEIVELVLHTARAPESLNLAIADRLSFLSDPTAQELRLAALLGAEFSVADLAAVSGRKATELVDGVNEAMAAGVLTERGDRLAFRHPLIREALYAAIPAGLRSALHQEAARALVDTGAPAGRIAAQLLAAPDALTGWIPEWLVRSGAVLTQQAPQVAAQLLESAVDQLPSDDPLRFRLEALLAIAAFALGHRDQTERLARHVIAYSHEPDLVAEMSWTLARTLQRSRLFAEARLVVDTALRDAATPPMWRARLLAVSARVRRYGRRDSAEAVDEALAEAERSGDPVAIGHALHEVSQVRLLQRDTAAGLRAIRRGLTVIGDDPRTADLRQLLLINQTAFLAEFDEWEQAQTSMREAIDVGERIGTPRLCTVYTTAADCLFASGHWDDAIAALEAAAEHLPARDAWPELWERVGGCWALIAGHRDDSAAVEQHLTQADSILLVRARALAAERAGRPEQALAVLKETLDPERAEKYQTWRQRWSPQLVRLALALGEPDTARTATRLVEIEADGEREPVPNKAAVAQWCQGLLAGDARTVLAVADHFSKSGRPLEFGNALEDAAMLMAGDDQAAALRTVTEAVDVYLTLGAAWDVIRADARARPLGVRRGQRGPRRRPSSGWDSLTATELKVARLVAGGKSNPDIAAELFLSRRTVQTHVSHILAKLGAHSRAEIARLAGERSAAPE